MPEQYCKPRNFNHPKKGSSTKTEPKRNKCDIERIKALLKGKPRDYCLFTLGINTAFRASELVSILVGQVSHLRPFDTLTLKQPKTGKFRTVTINQNAYEAIRLCLAAHPDRDNLDAPLFCSITTRKALKATTLSKYMKEWCALAGLQGQFSSHTIRKTWGYSIYRYYNHDIAQSSRKIAEIMMAFGHKTERQTLDYLCISDREIQTLFQMEL